MALNPQLFPNGMPVAFVNELFVLARDGVEFEIDKIPGSVSFFWNYVIYTSVDWIILYILSQLLVLDCQKASNLMQDFVRS